MDAQLKTGRCRRVDPAQRSWLDEQLERRRLRRLCTGAATNFFGLVEESAEAARRGPGDRTHRGFIAVAHGTGRADLLITAGA